MIELLRRLPPGRYFLGDPCYCFDKLWDELVDPLIEHNDQGFKITLSDGREGAIYSASTAYGDGTYAGTDGFDYSVDAGMIGVVQDCLAEKMDDTCGRIIDAPGGLSICCDGGLFSVRVYDEDGSRLEAIDIDTDPAGDDDDEDDGGGGEGEWHGDAW